MIETAADLDTMVADFGVEVAVDDQWFAKGILDVVDRTLIAEDSAALVGKLHLLTVRTGVLGPLAKEGKTITVDRGNGNESFKIRSVLQAGDGEVSQMFLLRV